MNRATETTLRVPGIVKPDEYRQVHVTPIADGIVRQVPVVLGDHVRRAKQNRHTGAGALRMRAAEFLVGVFQKRLGHPYHGHVATIATVISRIPTDADFVKKVEARQGERNGQGGK